MKDFVSMPSETGASEEDRKFNAAFEAILNMDRSDYPNWMGGIMFASGTDFQVGSPIDNSIIIGQFQEPEAGMAVRAVSFASQAFTEWSSLPLSIRIERMRSIRDDLVRGRYRLAAAICISVGMTRKEALAEMDRLREVMDGCLQDAEDMEGKDRPTGVWAVIGSYHSPVAAPISSTFAALLAGNTVVLMPSHLCPLPTYMIYEMMSRKGLPDGALNLLLDRRGKVQKDLVDNPELAGVCVSGSGEGSEEMMFAQVDPDLRFHAEIKGMNPAVISQRSDLKYAAEAVLDSAFSYSGQRLDSCSKVVVLDQHYEQFLNILMKAASRITVGDPAENGVFTGPVINKEMMQRFLDLMDGARPWLLMGGERLTKDFLGEGCFVRPAILAGLPEDHELNTMDHSLPILCVQRASDLEDAIEKVNACEFGLSAGIFTKDEKEMERFLATINADNAYVNGPSTELGPASKISLADFQG
ncbi:MAG: aldehyde dehydrogenase family protein [Candidatus Methanomethylophilaceae archaeon]|nr:aldehyde dehydrogenase family protein [Candidatus Methanomethylophilaceae archaeon]